MRSIRFPGCRVERKIEATRQGQRFELDCFVHIMLPTVSYTYSRVSVAILLETVSRRAPRT